MSEWQLLLLVALKPEWDFLRRRIKCQRLPGKIHLYQLDSDPHAALLQTGPGPDACTNNLVDFFLEHKVRSILHFGCCGALASELKNGDVFRAREITDGHAVITCDAAANALSKLAETRLYTSSVVLKNVSAKMAAAKTTGARIVDMESYPAAFLCRERGIQYDAVRGVFDSLEDDLTDMGNPCNDAGDISATRLATNILRQPRLILELPHLKKMADRVSQILEPIVLDVLRTSPLSF